MKLRAIVFLLMLIPAAGYAVGEGALGIIQETSERILVRLAEKPEIASDPAQLRVVVNESIVPSIDFILMSRLTLGKYWRKASPEQRDRFILALYRSLVKTYASGILEYRGDQLKILPVTDDLSEGKVIVETRVTLDTGVETPVNYRMRLTDGGWKAYDVIIEGISYVANYRKQYASEFRAKGMGPVIGTRTWGGLVGVSMSIRLMDGSRLTAPDYRVYTPEGEWTVENEGVTPDIEVELEPADVMRGWSGTPCGHG